MLTVVIPESELFDSNNNEFIQVKEQTLVLEHSLVSLAKWESKWKKSYLHSNKTWGEELDYIRCMTITKNVNPTVYQNISRSTAKQINEYINDPMTATTFKQHNGVVGRQEIITAEIIYYWMVSFNIPFECQKWHLNRLLALINVCGIKASPEKKMSQQEVYTQNRDLNELRKKQLHSKG